MDTRRYLFVINDAPYGNERSYNALRHAMNLVKREGVEVKVFLVADAVYCARKDQKTPDGYYNIERMVKSLAKRGKVATWGTCCDARGLGSSDLTDGVEMGSMDLLGDWTLEASQVLVY